MSLSISSSARAPLAGGQVVDHIYSDHSGAQAALIAEAANGHVHRYAARQLG
jgi:hypothetical protein